MELKSGIIKVGFPYGKKQVIKALCKMAEIDNDFTGKNGIEFASMSAIECGYDSDYDYVVARCKAMKNKKDIISVFSHCLFKDKNYYKQFHVNVLNRKGIITAIAYSFITD